MATSVKLDDALKRRIDRLAAAKDRSAHWIMREAIREYVEREERGTAAPGAMSGSFQDRAQDEIVPPTPRKRRPEQLPLRPWSEVVTITPDPRADPARDAAWERFRALGGAATSMSSFRSKDDIDAYIRWLRDHD